MASAGVQGPARVPTPLPKAPPITGVSPESASTSAFGARPVPPPPLQQQQQHRRRTRPSTADPLSDKATEVLIRRALCPQHLDKGRGAPASIEDVLPPLTSRNDVDLQLYALFAIILREYVQSWYAKITPDETFVAEIIQIIAHCTRALEQRLRKVDLESLLFDELPDLLDRHVTAYRVAHNPIARPPIQTDPREIYHSLCPLPALSPVPKSDDATSVGAQADNETAYRQLLVRGMLAVLLPTEDLENECLTALVGQILSELIIGNLVAGKLSQPWFVMEILIILAGVIRRSSAPANREERKEQGEKDSGPTRSHSGFSIQWLFASVVHWCVLIADFVRFLAATMILSCSLPPRVSHGTAADATHQKQAAEPMDAAATTGFVRPAGGTTEAQQQPPMKAPVLAFRCWAAISNLIEMDVRMPWLCGTLSLLQWLAMTGPGRIAGVDGALDRLLSHYIRHYVLDPASLPPLLRTVRGSLFPDNMPGTSGLVAPSSEAELCALRRRCAKAILALVPSGVTRVYLGGLGARGFASLSVRTAAAPAAGALEQASRGRDQRPQEQRSAHRANSDRGTSRGLEENFPGQSSTCSNSTDSAAAKPGTTAEQPPAAAAARRDDARLAKQASVAARREHGQTTEASEGNTAGGDGDGDGSAQALTGDGETDGEEEARMLAEIETGILDVFSDAYCNKHLVYGAVELLVVRLIPELAEKGVLELWEERLS